MNLSLRATSRTLSGSPGGEEKTIQFYAYISHCTLNIIVFLVYTSSCYATEEEREKDRRPSAVEGIECCLLLQAADQNNLVRLKSLLSEGADVNQHTKNGVTALMIAAFHGDIEITETLIEHGAMVNRETIEGLTPLTIAATSEAKNSIDIMRILISHGPNIDVRDAEGRTALVGAAMTGEGSIEKVKLLIDSGANINLADERGGSPLLYALMRGQGEVVKLFCNNETLIIRDSVALGMLPMWQHNEENLNILIDDCGIDINAKGTAGTTLLRFAVVNRYKDAVEFLIKRGADVNARNEKKTVALMHAALKGHTQIAKLLIDAGAVVDVKDEKGDTALMYAVRNKQLSTVKLLLEADADPNSKNNDEETPVSMTDDEKILDILSEKTKKHP